MLNLSVMLKVHQLINEGHNGGTFMMNNGKISCHMTLTVNFGAL